MKYLALLKVFDKTLSKTWHDKDSMSFRSKWGFYFPYEAEKFLTELRREICFDDSKRYDFEEIILPYPTSMEEEVQEFFRYL